MADRDEEFRLYRAILDGARVLVSTDPDALARGAQMAIAEIRMGNRELRDENGRLYNQVNALKKTLREIIDGHDDVSKMEGRDWDRARELASIVDGGPPYRSHLLEREGSDG